MTAPEFVPVTPNAVPGPRLPAWLKLPSLYTFTLISVAGVITFIFAMVVLVMLLIVTNFNLLGWTE